MKGMNEPVKAESLDWHRARAVQSVGRFAGLARRTVEAAWEAGRDLQAVRDASPHGTYRAWLAEAGINRETDRRLRSLYERYPEKTQVVSFGSMAEALGAGKSAGTPAGNVETTRGVGGLVAISEAVRWGEKLGASGGE